MDNNQQTLIIDQISRQTNLNPNNIKTVLSLLEEGNTIPFIARYRKDQTGSLDEVQINGIQQQFQYATQLAERKEEVIRLIDEQEKLTPELKQQIDQATQLQQIEDLYRPYRQRRRTLAMTAIENGLEPFADWMLENTDDSISPTAQAQNYLNDAIETIEEALKGAHEIIAQRVSDDAVFREFIRKYMRYNGRLTSTIKDEEKDERQIYKMYYDYNEAFQRIQPHNLLAINRAEKEDVVTVRLVADEEPVINYMTRRFMPENLPTAQQTLIVEAIEDAYKRFIEPSIVRELRNELTDEADRQAIHVFSDNLRHLLLQPPLKGQIVMGFDPAFRTGCKLAIINETGALQEVAVIFPHPPASRRQREQAGPALLKLIEKYDVQIIAIGNGTASRESELFVSELIQEHQLPTRYMIVNEAGASVYSASKLAREEFPDLEVEERSAVSIARRIQDPLAELIKIDPQSMGIGQYQHDVSQRDLKEAIDFVVNVTVNQVGVDINTASATLLEHVSGLSKATAKNIVEKRQELGHFTTRDQIKDVKRLGPKSFEQSAGFLRILNGNNPLDQTSIHPESYAIAERLLSDHDIDLQNIGQEEVTEQLAQLNPDTLAEKYDVGVATIVDILKGLQNPTADIRDDRDGPILRGDVLSIKDIEVGMEMQGEVRNVVDFGAFVDIGVDEDGLIHRSQLGIRRNQHPSDAVSVGDIVHVEVISIDLDRQRIGLRLQKS